MFHSVMLNPEISAGFHTGKWENQSCFGRFDTHFPLHLPQACPCLSPLQVTSLNFPMLSHRKCSFRKGVECLLILARKNLSCCCYKVLWQYGLWGWGVQTTCVKDVCCSPASPGKKQGLGKRFKGWALLSSCTRLLEQGHGTELHGCHFSPFLACPFTVAESSEIQLYIGGRVFLF